MTKTGSNAVNSHKFYKLDASVSNCKFLADRPGRRCCCKTFPFGCGAFTRLLIWLERSNLMNIYYNFDKLFSYNFLIALVIGERGVGKSFNAKVAVLKKFLKSGEQFIYLRRYKTELDSALATFWDDVQDNGYFDDLNLKVKKSKMLTTFTCDGEVCGYAVPLSTCNILKSTAFPKVKTIIFDEFILDTDSGTYKYMKNEPQMLLDVMETVFRLRDGQVIMLGNYINFFGCPYVAYWNLDLPYNSEFRTFKDGTIVVNYIKNLAYRDAKKQSRFYRLIEGTVYGDYCVDNKSLRESTSFIGKRPDRCKFYATLVINGSFFGLWSGIDGYLYVSDKYDPTSGRKYACDFDDHTEDTVFLTFRDNYYLRYMIKAYRQGWLKFENQRIKSDCLTLLNRCLSI